MMVKLLCPLCLPVKLINSLKLSLNFLRKPNSASLNVSQTYRLLLNYFINIFKLMPTQYK